MRTFITSILLLSQVSFAQPEYLKDAVITVTLKNGKTYTFSANTHKVVERIEKQEEQQVVPVVTKLEVQKKKGTRVTGLITNAPVGLRQDGIRISVQHGHSVGVSVQDQITDDFHYEVILMDNNTMGVGVGFEL